ncbi:hypothetical protein [Halocynthiibacter styelae]|uniref:Uncharacterized protein n=1 Tax=Halocynthiibacter styelae TaxID=2761955 RepID=A0A8J7LKP0_9RHOB|nr:hypothetical protein [Paenihalocynthiibacter styelae]MBI1494375.1 hypothetical protein [Paenihalocynthiibacter styelae]
MKDKTTKGIPKAYSRFSALFSQMDTPLLQVMGGVLRALPDATFREGDFENQPTGEFVGYDGLDTRGSLSNLTETEWLMRELAPDDFIRRVAEGEVLFRKRNFENSGKRNTCAVILDCGAWMLGHNRLAGLASLFHLAIRAERMNAELAWIVPGLPDQEWNKDLTLETVQRYLGQIVQTPLSGEIIGTALAALDVDGRLECWYVGAGQTASAADHREVTGAMIITSLYDEAPVHTAEISVRNRGRILKRTNVTFEDDSTCIAALRRPFRPEVRRADPQIKHDTNETVLSSLPYKTRWRFDRFNKAVEVHLEEGVLWQPVGSGQLNSGIWIPKKTGETLIGFQVRSEGRLSAMTARTSTSKKPGICDVVLYEANLKHGSTAPKPTATGSLQVDISHLTGQPVGNMHHEGNTISLVHSDGIRHAFMILDNGNLTGPKGMQPRVVMSNETYLIQIHTDGTPRPLIEAHSVNRHKTLLQKPLLDPEKHLGDTPRHVLYDPQSKTVAISFDGREYEIYGFENQAFQIIPDGLALLHMEGTSYGLAWNSKSSELIRLSFHYGKAHQQVMTQYHGLPVSLPRYCSFMGVTLAIQTDEDGQPEHIVPIHGKKGWGKTKPINIHDAIERARTIWLNS